MSNTTPIETRWADYYRRGYEPPTMVDRLRVDMLRGRIVGPATTGPESARLASEVRRFERLGYDVERIEVPTGAATGAQNAYQYRVLNRDHRPTPEQFAAARASTSSTSVELVPSSNGHSAPRRNGHRVRAFMLPQLGESLIVTVVGFAADGKPMLVLTGPDGWRYECSVTASEVTRTGG